MLTFIDFFAGIGGFRRGMELAGHKCIGFCEFDKSLFLMALNMAKPLRRLTGTFRCRLRRCGYGSREAVA